MLKLKKNQGFTLIELIIAVTIIAILVGISVPLLINHSKNASDRAREANAKVIYEVTQIIFTDNPKLSDILPNITGNKGVIYIGEERILKKIEDDETLSEITDSYTAEILKILAVGYTSNGLDIWPDGDLNVGFSTGTEVQIWITYESYLPDKLFYPKKNIKN